MALSRPSPILNKAGAEAAPARGPVRGMGERRLRAMLRRRQPGVALLLATALAWLAVIGQAGGATPGRLMLAGCLLLGLAQLCRPAAMARAAGLGLALPLWFMLLELLEKF